jgi:hypothetical protein
MGAQACLSPDPGCRSATKDEIGHMKTDGCRRRCTLTGTISDALLAALCACRHGICKIWADPRAWAVWTIGAILAANNALERPHQIVIATMCMPNYAGIQWTRNKAKVGLLSRKIRTSTFPLDAAGVKRASRSEVEETK